ncbi:MAG TPA: hypothetical protein VLH79_11930 [Chthonomonadales bacterium]|nr:hypothetical protein [Chthonomonadales bacterium]
MVRQGRKLFSLGEAATLAAMGMAVASGALPWEVRQPESALPTPLPAVFVSRLTMTVIGFDVRIGWLRAGWIVLACAVVCGTLLLWEPTSAQRRAYLAIQTALGVVALVVALVHVGPHLGVILGALSGILMIAGAYARYR